MIRYIIRNKKTGKFLYRAKGGGGVTSMWVDSSDNATLITTPAAASLIATQFCGKDEFKRQLRYYQSHARFKEYPVEVIKVNILMFPVGAQPFFDGKVK